MIVSTAIAMSFAVPASAITNCNGVSTSYGDGCGEEYYPYPTNKVPPRQHIYPEFANYSVTEVEVEPVTGLGMTGRYLVFTGLSSGSPQGGYYVRGKNGKFEDGRTDPPNTAPVYLTSTRSTWGTAIWTGISQAAGSLWRIGRNIRERIMLLF